MLTAYTSENSFSCWKLLPILNENSPPARALGSRVGKCTPFPPVSSLEMEGSKNRQPWFESQPCPASQFTSLLLRVLSLHWWWGGPYGIGWVRTRGVPVVKHRPRQGLAHNRC